MKLKDFKQFTLNENKDNDSHLEKKVKDKHAAEDHLEKEGVVWTDLKDHKDGQGFARDGENVAHYNDKEGRLYIYDDPSKYYSEGDDAVDKFDDEVSSKTKNAKAYYDKEGLGTGSDYAKGEISDLAYAGDEDMDDDEDYDWEDENNWQMDDLPFDEDV